MNSTATTNNRVGLVAGWGSFPLELAQQCVNDGAELFVVGLTGHASPELSKLAKEFRWMGVAKLGGHIAFFKKHQVTQVALAGKLFKDQLLYHGMGWLGLVPDWTCIRAMAPIFITRSRDGRDDSILASVVASYQQYGIKTITVNAVAPELLIPEGVLVGSFPSHRQWADIRFGWQQARQMGRLDIGQSIVVKDQMVLAVEAIEGTDAMIQRTEQLCPRGGFSLIKVSKPNQDMRFDVPTIGPGTVEKLAAAGGKLIVVEAGMTILVERDATINAAKRLGISIIALTEASALQSPYQTNRDAA